MILTFHGVRKKVTNEHVYNLSGALQLIRPTPIKGY